MKRFIFILVTWSFGSTYLLSQGKVAYTVAGVQQEFVVSEDSVLYHFRSK